jgi:hypothetical protein
MSRDCGTEQMQALRRRQCAMRDGIADTPGICERRTIAFRRPGKGALALVAAVLVTLSLSLHPASGGDGMDVDAAIVFAVDMSTSIDPRLADLQRIGHAEALRSAEVGQAIARGARGCIAVTYVEWSVPGWLRTVLPWTQLCRDGDREAAAAQILEQGRSGREKRGRGSTAISYALEASGILLDRLPGRADRKIIDISSNGTNNDGLPVVEARDRVLAKGYVINAIVLDHVEPEISDDLPGYFRERVIGGPWAFVIVPEGPDQYTAALRRKLVLEIGADHDDRPAVLLVGARRWEAAAPPGIVLRR